MTRRVLNAVRQKKEAWERDRWKRSRRSFTAYCRIRNRDTNTVYSAKCTSELRLANETISNPRAFYTYTRSKTTINEEVLSLIGEDRQPTMSLLGT